MDLLTAWTFVDDFGNLSESDAWAYACDYTFRTKNRTKKNKLIIISFYQKKYIWKKKRWEKLSQKTRIWRDLKDWISDLLTVARIIHAMAKAGRPLRQTGLRWVLVHSVRVLRWNWYRYTFILVILVSLRWWCRIHRSGFFSF